MPRLPPIEWAQVMNPSQMLVQGFLQGGAIELDGGVMVVLDGDVVRIVDSEEDWATDSEDDEQDTHSSVVSIRGPLCMTDYEGSWSIDGSENEWEEIGGNDGMRVEL